MILNLIYTVPYCEWSRLFVHVNFYNVSVSKWRTFYMYLASNNIVYDIPTYLLICNLPTLMMSFIRFGLRQTSSSTSHRINPDTHHTSLNFAPRTTNN